MSSAGAVPYGKDGSPAPSRNNSGSSTPIARASTLRADQTQQNLQRWPPDHSQPDIIHAGVLSYPSTGPDSGSSKQINAVSTPSSDTGFNRSECQCSVRCEACGKNIRVSTGSPKPTQNLSEHGPVDRSRSVTGLTSEEAEILAEISRNKIVAPYVSSVRRTVMGMAIVWWTLFGYSFSKCKNTGECNEMLNMVRFVRAAPTLIWLPVLGGVLFGTAIWMTYLLDMTVHLMIGVVRLSRWLFGQDGNDAEETPELTSFIATRLPADEQRSEESHTAREGSPAYRLQTTRSLPTSGVSTSTTKLSTSERSRTPERPAQDEGLGDAERPDDDDRRSPSKDSGSWVGLPSLLTGVFTSDAQENKPPLQGVVSDDPYPADAQIPFRKATDTTTETGTETRVSFSTTPEATNPEQLAAYMPSSSVSKSADTTKHTSSPGQILAQEEATAVEATVPGNQDSRSSMEMLAEIPATFMALVRRSGEAIHDALFWESASPNGGEQNPEEDGSGGTTTTGTATSTQTDAGRSRAEDPTADTVEEREAQRRESAENEAEPHELLPNDSYGTKHSEASDLEKRISSATSSQSERSRRIVAVHRRREDGAGRRESRRPGIRSHDDVQQCRRGSCKKEGEANPIQISKTLMAAQKELAGHTSGGFLAEKIESAGASSSHGSRSRRRMEEAKFVDEACVKQACSRNTDPAPATASADYALMGSTARNDKTHTETSDQNTSALKVSPCTCDAKAPESGLKGGSADGGSLPRTQIKQNANSAVEESGQAGASLKSALLKAPGSKRPNTVKGGSGSGKGQNPSCEGSCPATLFNSAALARGAGHPPEFMRRMAPQQQRFNSRLGLAASSSGKPLAAASSRSQTAKTHTESFSAARNERKRPPAGEAMLITEHEAEVEKIPHVDAKVDALNMRHAPRPSAASMENLLSHLKTESGIQPNAAHHRRRRRLEPRHGPLPCSVFGDETKRKTISEGNAEGTSASFEKNGKEKLKKFTGRSSSGGCDSSTIVSYRKTVAELQEMLRLECIRAIEAPFSNDSGQNMSDSDPLSSNSVPIRQPRRAPSQSQLDRLCRSAVPSDPVSRSSLSCTSDYCTQKSTYH